MKLKRMLSYRKFLIFLAVNLMVPFVSAMSNSDQEAKTKNILLVQAAARGYLVREVLHKEMFLSMRNAITCKNVDLVKKYSRLCPKLLITKNTSDNNKYLLHYAAQVENVEIMEELIKGAFSYHLDSRKILRIGSSIQSIDTLNRTLGVVNVRDGNGNSPLHWACVKCQEPVVRFLLECGAKVDVKATDQRTPLHIIAYMRELEGKADTLAIVSMLLEKNSDPVFVDAQDDTGQTALHKAAYTGSFGVVKLLCQAGADITIQDLNGKTALHKAQENTNCRDAIIVYECEKIVRYLQEMHKQRATKSIAVVQSHNKK